MAEYIERLEDGTLRRCTERPTQAEIKERGLGITWLYRPDGSLQKAYTVEGTRTGGRKITAENPRDLEGVSTLNLQRMNRAYDKIVKHWPAQATAQRKIKVELEGREKLLGQLNSATKVKKSKGKRVAVPQSDVQVAAMVTA
jgi:hypothetical protein